MARRLVECVPNFSEGRRPEVVDEIAAAISSVPGVLVLDRHIDASHNRSVITFAGEPEAAKDAAFRAIEAAARLIDISKHEGVHPRIGACDVVPFVPLGSATMRDCVGLAEALGKQVADRLGIPVYLYEHAARRPERRLLANIRRGEYEALAREIETSPDRAPDFGPARIHPTAGAVAIGARTFLIAFNVNLGASDPAIARHIAAKIREAGGGFEAVRALGFQLDEQGVVQVSMNLVDYQKTGLVQVFERVRDLAREQGVEVRGSELVGLVPEAAVHAAARDALKLGRFDRAQVVEERIADLSAGPMDLYEFLDGLSSSAPSPGGGSAAALAGALGAAAAEKVANLTRQKDRHAAQRPEFDALARALQSARWELLRLVERDAGAFEGILAAHRLPKSPPEDAARRARAIEDATLEACRSPLAVAETAAAVLRAAFAAAERGNMSAIADAVAAAALGRAAVEGAHAMLRVNLPGLADRAAAAGLRARFDDIRREVAELSRQIEERFEAHLASATRR
jgi:glutamate formiminotransferase/formiminotetrahydrofolate cyclodeaminase